ncbi:MAG: hypothetical protein K0U78_01950 [Actinomycetia bacterium]|nr:hypothetical protein [Actinomycetes bacterium]
MSKRTHRETSKMVRVSQEAHQGLRDLMYSLRLRSLREVVDLLAMAAHTPEGLRILEDSRTPTGAV